jgi:hypothetical protein
MDKQGLDDEEIDAQMREQAVNDPDPMLFQSYSDRVKGLVEAKLLTTEECKFLHIMYTGDSDYFRSV